MLYGMRTYKVVIVKLQKLMANLQLYLILRKLDKIQYIMNLDILL
jgi:hypothetical protein